MKVIYIILFALFILTGCGYTIQTQQTLPFEAIAIGSITNTTSEPKLQDRLLSILNEAAMSYGFYVSKNARYRLEGEITRFNLKVLSEISLTASEYEVDIAGNFFLVDTKTSKKHTLTILRPFSSHFITKERLTDVLIQKEVYTRKALKEIAQELIREIIYNPPERR
ncbi:MAG TPA: hypothetical protein HPP56_05935 [Nitrospirae bacterium]|nr:hypothetical protein [Nitrospirota bacterium]